MENPSHLTKDQQTSLKIHQNNIAAIYKDRKRILQEINQKEKQKKYINSSDHLSKIHSFNSQTQLHENPRKLIKTDPLSNKSIQQDNPQKPSSNPQQTTQLKKNQKSSGIPQAIADRNRRMFGGLTSHLRKAGQHLHSQAQKQKQQNTKSILNKFISKQKQQRQEQDFKKKELFETQLSKLHLQKKENEQKMNKAENQMLSYIVKSHFNAIGKFYLTKTEPKLFWKPKKDLQDHQKAQKLKLYAERQLKKQEEELLEKVTGYDEVFDHGKYMTQNQRQFYTSTIKHLFLNHKNLIMTKTEPSIFWKSKKPFRDLEALLTDTSTRLDEKSTQLNTINQEYYKSREGNIIEEHNKDFSDEEHEDYQEKNE